MLAISHIDCSQLISRFDSYQLQLGLPDRRPWIQRQISSTKLRKPLWTPLVHHSNYAARILYCISVVFFTFLEIIKHTMPKILIFSSIFYIRMTIQKFTNFDKFFFFLKTLLYDSCRNTIVLNEVKGNWILLEPAYGKHQTNFFANPIFIGLFKSA